MSDSWPTPKVFVSYSHQPPEHAERVRSIAQRLASDGVDVELDLWSVREGQDLYAFMERMVTDPEVAKVLVFCNRSYVKKANARKRGVGVEAQIISAEVYGKVAQEKFIPIVCELDENGNAYLPTFFSSRFYIDFSSVQAEVSNYERLVRLVFNKPEHTKPAVGRPPAFLSEGTVLANPLESAFRMYREAVMAGKSNTLFLIEDFIERFLDVLSQEHLVMEPGVPADEALVASLERMKPIKDTFLCFCDVWIRTAETGSFVPHIVTLLEKVRSLGEGADVEEECAEDRGEAFRLLGHELFLSVVALLLQRHKFPTLAELVGTRLLVRDRQAPGGSKAGPFILLYEHSEALIARNRRLGLSRVDLQGDLLQDRATSNAAPLVWVQHADLMLAVVSLCSYPDEPVWYPRTIPFVFRRGRPFELFERAESLAFYKKLAVIWHGLDPEAFRIQLRERISAGIVKEWRRDYARPDWEGWLNLVRLGASP